MRAKPGYISLVQQQGLRLLRADPALYLVIISVCKAEVRLVQEGAVPVRGRPEVRVVLADVAAPADPPGRRVVQEEGAEAVAGGEAVQQTGGVGDVVVVELTVRPAPVSPDVHLQI